MMSIVVFVLSALFLSSQAQFTFDSSIMDAANSFPQIATGGSADTAPGSGTAISGNEFNVAQVTNLNPAGPDFGVGVGQSASENEAIADSGDASSGNRIGFGSIDSSSLTTEQVAEFNFAQADEGDANAGNQFEVEGATTDSPLDIDQSARYNQAFTDSGFANAGNFASLDSFTGGSIDDNSQGAIGNTAQSDSGDANAGNIFNFGNLGGRKLQKLQDI
eukprot:TRINITY_DN42_c0_g1_i8.p3 TRINITY_DN42_c0_g1~~TRINITY_DN42_c0_g1_i8.p3  ORF type:complete len:219 (-),score=49.89 TRINITY_DN42_c0_g1_i8:997-1653(-)